MLTNNYISKFIFGSKSIEELDNKKVISNENQPATSIQHADQTKDQRIQALITKQMREPGFSWGDPKTLTPEKIPGFFINKTRAAILWEADLKLAQFKYAETLLKTGKAIKVHFSVENREYALEHGFHRFAAAVKV